MDFITLVSDPFVGVGLMAVAWALIWLARRDKSTAKYRYLRTAEECRAHGVDPIYAGYWRIPVDTPTKKSKAQINALVSPAPVTSTQSDTRLPSQPVPRIKLSTIADDRGPMNILVAGAKGSGKTVVLRTILVRRAPRIDACLSIDSHASPDKWPCSVVGGGLDYPAIDSALRNMSADMRLRFVQLRDGEVKEGAFPNRYYVGDEWLSVSAELSGKDGAVHAGKMLIERLVNGRKVNDAIMAAAQNDTVDALGIQGNASIKACFDYIVYLGGLAADRPKFHGCPPSVIEAAMKQDRPGVVWITFRNQWAVLDYDIAPVLEGTTVVNLFPPFVSPTTVGIDSMVSGDVSQIGVGMPNTEHTSRDTKVNTAPNTSNDLSDDVIKTLHAAGWSKTKIAEKMTGDKRRRLDKVAESLARTAEACNDDDEEAQTEKSTQILTA